MSNHFPLDEQPFRTLYYVRGDEKTVGGSACISSQGSSGFKEQLSFERESQHHPRVVAPQYGLAVKASLRPHADRAAIVGGVALEASKMIKGDTPVERASLDFGYVDPPEKSNLVKSFQESRYFTQTTEQLRAAGRYPVKPSSTDYGHNAYAVRAHVAIPWISKNDT